ncbi:MAG: signal peptidase [Actinomycetota bacterium]|nr:signal peptidase [Actinomycetota bacterium]
MNPNTCEDREEPGLTSRERPSPSSLRDRLRSPVRSTVPEGPLRSVVRVFSFLLTVALLLAGIRFFLVQTFVIPSGSMENTLQVGDRVIVSRWSYRFGEIQRGDVVVFDGEGVFSKSAEEPGSPLAAVGRGVAKALGMPVGETDYVKRVIGLPGDRVTCCDAHKRLMVNGKSMSEPYLYPGDSPSELRFDISVPEGRLWVMGDHRSDSGDSREHMNEPSGGTVPVGQVVGRVVAIWWPLDRWSGMGRSGTLLESGGGQEGGS